MVVKIFKFRAMKVNDNLFMVLLALLSYQIFSVKTIDVKTKNVSGIARGEMILGLPEDEGRQEEMGNRERGL